MSSPIQLTQKAVNKIKEALTDKPEYDAIRIGMTTKGCNGFSYLFEYADNPYEYDETHKQDGITVYIDPKAIMFLLGTTIDYHEGLLQSGFIFDNPIAASTCGCGESFSV